MNEAILVFFLIFLLAAGGIVINVLFLLTLQNTLKACRPQNQLVPPTNVWLMFIPFFNMIYPFILYPKIADSVKRELEARGHREPGDYGRTIGILIPAFILGCIIPFLNILLMIAVIVFVIMYWSKMSNYKNMILRMPILEKEAPININYSGQSDLLDNI